MSPIGQPNGKTDPVTNDEARLLAIEGRARSLEAIGSEAGSTNDVDRAYYEYGVRSFPVADCLARHDVPWLLLKLREAVEEEREVCARICSEAAAAFKDRQVGTVGLHRTLNEEREAAVLQIEQAIRSRGKEAARG